MPAARYMDAKRTLVRTYPVMMYTKNLNHEIVTRCWYTWKFCHPKPSRRTLNEPSLLIARRILPVNFCESPGSNDCCVIEIMLREANILFIGDFTYRLRFHEAIC